MTDLLKCDAVFEGGGVKGLAFIGAIRATEEKGYQFERVAGTSAGSIMAALLAAGYTGEEMEEMAEEISFPSFLELTGVGRIPLLGKGLNLLLKNGIYNTDQLERWLEKKLRLKGVVTFGDLPAEKLKIIASDISNGRLMIIPDDLPHYGVDPETFPIAKAVRMSCSIPFFFQPVVLDREHKKTYILDGGLLSNFPVWLFDVERSPRWPTFGYRLRGSEAQPAWISGPVTLFRAILSTMLEAHDKQHIRERDALRTIFIPVEGIKATDFSLTKAEKEKLVRLGREEAERFFERWSFKSYLYRYRS